MELGHSHVLQHLELDLLCQKIVLSSNIVLHVLTKNYFPVVHFENGKFIPYLSFQIDYSS